MENLKGGGQDRDRMQEGARAGLQFRDTRVKSYHRLDEEER